jgi:hypothetical protein
MVLSLWILLPGNRTLSLVACLPCLLLHRLLCAIRSWHVLLLLSLSLSLICRCRLPLIVLLLRRLTQLAVGLLVILGRYLRWYLCLLWDRVSILILLRLTLLLWLPLRKLVLCRLSILPLLLLNLGWVLILSRLPILRLILHRWLPEWHLLLHSLVSRRI